MDVSASMALSSSMATTALTADNATAVSTETTTRRVRRASAIAVPCPSLTGEVIERQRRDRRSQFRTQTMVRRFAEDSIGPKPATNPNERHVFHAAVLHVVG